MAALSQIISMMYIYTSCLAGFPLTIPSHPAPDSLTRNLFFQTPFTPTVEDSHGVNPVDSTSSWIEHIIHAVQTVWRKCNLE
jgi:hypothetical protein